jgi:cell division protein FtsL
MDNINKSDKMNKPDKPDKSNNKLNKTNDINKMKLLDIITTNKKIMYTCILIAAIVFIVTIFMVI